MHHNKNTNAVSIKQLLQHHEHLSLGLGKSLGYILPVDDLPDVLQVVRSHILVLQVVGVLPHVNTQQRDQASGGLEGILVGSGGDSQSLVGLVPTQPAPSRTLHTDGGIGHGSLEVLQRAILGIDQVLQITGTQLSATLGGRNQVLPENGVVQVTTAVELDVLLQGNDCRSIILGDSISKLLRCNVQVVDIGGMVLGMVNFHNLGRNEGFKFTIVIGQIRQGELGSRKTSRALGNRASSKSHHLQQVEKTSAKRT